MAKLEDTITVGNLNWGTIVLAKLLEYMRKAYRWDGENYPVVPLGGFWNM